MHNTSALWDELFANPDHYKIITAHIAGVEYGEDLIESCTVFGKVFDAPTVGRCVARELDLTFMPQGTIPRLAKIELFVALTDGAQTSERLPKGVFYIDTRQTDTETGMMTIKGYDAILMMEQAFEMPSTTMKIVFDYGGNNAVFYPALGSSTPAPDPFYKPGYVVNQWSPEPDKLVSRNIKYSAVQAEEIYGPWLSNSCYLTASGNFNALNNMVWSWTTVQSRPWHEYRNQILNAEIRDDVTFIVTNAFFDCQNLKTISLTKSVESVSSGAFDKCVSLSDIYYYGTEQEFELLTVDPYRNEPWLSATKHYLGDLP